MSVDDADTGIYAREIPSLDRWIQVGVAQGKVISTSFPETPDDDAGDDHPLLDRIRAYLEGEPTDFDDVDVGLTVPTTQRRVLETLRSVPYGENVSVEQLARMTPDLDPESDDDLATVRTALAENPLPLVVPDHRVRDGPSGAPPGVEQRLRAVEGL